MNEGLNLASSYLYDAFAPIRELLKKYEEDATLASKEANVESEKTTTEEIKDLVEEAVTPKEEVKVETTEKEKICPVKVKPKEEKIHRVKLNLDDNEDKITMKDRKICPVKVTPTKGVSIKVEPTNTNIEPEEMTQEMKDEQHRLHHLVSHLRNAGVQFSAPRRMSTGLYELEVIQLNGNPVTISVDNSGILYHGEIKFWLGRMMPGDEYMKAAILMTKTSLECVVRGQQIPARYFISEQMFNLNKVLDMRTLKVANETDRIKVLEKAAKVIGDEDVYNYIIKAANGEPFRFAFCRYQSVDEFSLVSSKRNTSSNLVDDKLHVSKEIWLNVKKNKEGKTDVEMITRYPGDKNTKKKKGDK